MNDRYSVTSSPRVVRVFLLLVLAAAAWPAQAQDRAATERQLQRLRTQIQSAQRAVAQTRTEETSALASVEAVDSEIRLRENLLAGYRTQVAQSREETETLHRTIARLEAEIEATRANYRDRARHAYMYGRRSALAAILSAGSINQMLVRARYLQRFARQRRRQVERMDVSTNEVRAREVQVRSLLEGTQRTLLQAQSEANDLTRRKREREALVASLRNRRGSLERDLAQRRSDASQMEGLVRQLATAERQRAAETERQAEAARAAEAARVAEATRRAEAARTAETQRQADLAARRAAERGAVRRRPTPRADAPAPPPTAARTAAPSAPIAEAAPRRADPTPEPARRVDAAPSPAARPTSTPERRTSEAPRVRRVDEARTRPAPEPAPSRPAPAPPPAARPAPTPAPPPATRTAPAARPAPESRETTLGGSFAANRGRLPWPADGTVVGSFGARRDPVHGTTINSIGIDIATAGGAPARAVFDGTVERVGSMASFGTYVMVSHGSFTTVYGNLSAVSVARGATVRAGQALGRAGTSEARRGTQLFFAVFQDGRPVNPTGWLR